MEMHLFPLRSCTLACLYLLATCSLLGFICSPVMAADLNIEAELGDTINLHGVSYVGDRVYLFMTGPGLPENGVMLTDVSQRADQGHFTLIDLNNQGWSMKWNTARIQNEIDPGTYTVYVSNEPVDKAHLGGSNTYKTLEVFFRESTTERVSVSSGTSYTLKPEEHTSVVQAPTLALTSPTPTPTPTTPPTTLPTTIPPPTRASLLPVTALFAGVLCAGFIIRTRKK
jgi:hypothetical protein